MAAISLGQYERRPLPAAPSMEELIAASRARRAQQQPEEEATPKPTAAMRAVAYASDMREAFPHVHDDEEGDRLHRFSGAGYVETALACD